MKQFIHNKLVTCKGRMRDDNLRDELKKALRVE
jgi:hypothetical protein